MTSTLRSTTSRAALSLAALGALSVQAAGQVKITEFMYSGLDGEFIELTNVSSLPVDLEDWSIDDQSAIPGTYELSLAGIIDAGESIVVTDRIAANFTASWSLGATTVLGGNAISSLGRNDEIHLFDASGATVDVLAYGDEDFPGSIRTRETSGQGCDAGLGVDDIYRWTLASEGDAWGSTTSVNGD
ncbi:MAG: lamin tail domain-containing protein, partial [Planctomycetota bacterium]|nr:lamin tail domain-containing protein [Planctomycetota bacterium]